MTGEPIEQSRTALYIRNSFDALIRNENESFAEMPDLITSQIQPMIRRLRPFVNKAEMLNSESFY